MNENDPVSDPENEKTSPSSIEILKLNIEIWKTIIETQKHFNDLEMKVRNFGILLLSAFISAIGVSLNSGYTVYIGCGMEFPVGSVLALGAAMIWLLFYFVDVYWYHPLLMGAVEKGMELEKALKSEFPHINLTETIGRKSPQNILLFKNLRSTGKAKLFYMGVLVILLTTCVTLALARVKLS